MTPKENNEILIKLKCQPCVVSDFFYKIFQGLATGKDDVFFLHQCKYNENIVIAYSNMLGSDVELEIGIVKPLLKGEDVHRYDNIKTDRIVLLPYMQDYSLMKESYIQTNYPKAYSYLKLFEKELKDRENGRFDIDGKWFQFSRKQGLTSAETMKLVAPEISLGGNYAFDEKGQFYSTTKIYGYIKKNDVISSYKSLMAILNSKVMWYFMRNTGYVLRGGYYTFKTNYVKPFPMPSDAAIIAIEPVLIPLVDKVLLAKKNNPKADTSTEEREIDNIVFDLYGLTEEERNEIIKES